MNRLEYWIKAQTQYRVHSPFVFDMYRKVLMARLPRSLSRRLAREHGTQDRRYREMVYKVKDHYRLTTVRYDDDEAVLEGVPGGFEMVKVVCRPHASRLRELRWEAQCGDEKYNVSIDLYDVGLLLCHPKLRRQRFLLK